MKPLLLIASFLYCAAATTTRADVRMPAIFGDHMVLQQEQKLPVWGTAAPGEDVTVTVGAQSAKTKAAADRTWRVELPALPNGAPATTMTVAGKNTLTFADVLVGDVWLCGGQSNMQFALSSAHDSAEALPKANDPQLRYFIVHLNVKLEPQTDVTGKWVVCTPATAGAFSAAGYFFARDLRARLNRPIGLIGCNWGGTGAEVWTSLSALEKDPALKFYLDKYTKAKASYPQAAAEYPAKQAAYQQATAQWKKDVEPAYNAAVKDWEAAVASAKAAGQPAPPKPTPATPAPTAPPAPEGGYNTTTALYNGMLAPLIPYGLKGVIWYQGENNASPNYAYIRLFTALINDWRQRWSQPEMPFLFVQLSAYQAAHYWPVLRECQMKCLALPKTGMAVSLDVGELTNVHPRDKLDVGLRLALAARHVAYGEDLVYSGPTYDSMKVEGGTVHLNFQHVGGGLVVALPPWTAPGSPPVFAPALQSFRIAGADRKWYPAQAVIMDNAVLVSSPQVPQPVAVRYAWADMPACNFYNREGLPAPPFRTDDWDDVLTQPDPAPASAGPTAVYVTAAPTKP